MTKTKMECHELAKITPEMTTEEFQELKNSIAESGQREPGIVLDGKILDGRHRHKACDELDIPFAYRPFDKKRDGLIPEMVVLDANLRRRHLTPGQKAAIGAELSERIKVEKQNIKGGVGINAVEIASDKVGASRTSVTRAEKIKKDDPEVFDKVKKGEIGIKPAAEQIAIKQSRQDETRGEWADMIEPHHPNHFIEAIRDGNILKKPSELEEFCKLPVNEQKLIWDMIAKGWTTKAALNCVTNKLSLQSTINELINQAIKTPSKNHFATEVSGWEISATKI